MHVNSDQLPSILKQLTMSIEKRLSSLLSSKETSRNLHHNVNSTSQTADKKMFNYHDAISPNLITKGNNKETFYGPPHLIVRQSKQNLVSSFYS